ncbi:glycosyltransferase family 9 protein [Winogradskyella bathintestinalis]|uniref:Glycosyltransferase family 9 protein n=1 Tax=Winogradskyella bathintestinalis TaxID=3035208 RepID=A0ABT7ZRG2_9FLAO|nr:glycosyltransferase family 9 protein [Winogradskyella bathintestinalis]MDN3491598.1 glycosyltransferase family 9 protein [Winogradskyella bathintestinalis]
MPKPKHILVLRFSAMGDVAMTIPVLRALSEQHRDLKITVVTKAFFKPFFNDLENVSVYEADLKGKHKGILGLYKLAKELKALGFDVVADLHNVLRSKILKFFFFGKKVVQLDKGRADKKALTTGKNFTALKTTHQRYGDVFEALGFSIDLSEPTFPKPKPWSENLKTFISNKNLKTIGIAPFAAHQSKMYPLAQMESVIETLSKDYNIILFGGGKNEIEILNQLESKFTTVKSVAGKLNLEDELVLISNLNLMLAMDSGNAHIAAMLGQKVITIWGVTHPFAGFAPFNQREDFALTADRVKFPLIPTSIYGNKFPEGYEDAAGSVSVEKIVAKVASVI